MDLLSSISTGVQVISSCYTLVEAAYTPIKGCYIALKDGRVLPVLENASKNISSAKLEVELLEKRMKKFDVHDERLITTISHLQTMIEM
jgi:hypothetical protein